MAQKTAFKGIPWIGGRGDYHVYRTPDEMVVVVIDNLKNRQVKEFKGESAWSDAERYAEDMHVARNR
jgi:hypothetical protein